MKRFIIVLPEGLVHWVEVQAKKDHRSRNNFITHVLEGLREDVSTTPATEAPQQQGAK